jgi:hypothetical protein
MKFREKGENILTKLEHIDFIAGLIKGLFGLSLGTLMAYLVGKIVELSRSGTVVILLLSTAIALWLIQTIARSLKNRREVVARMIFYVVPIILGLAFCVWAYFVGTTIYRLNGDVRHLRTQMVRYVLPRALTRDQIEAFGRYLSSHSEPHEVRIKYILGDEEAAGYAEDFASAFRAGNWIPNTMPVNPAAVTCKPNPSGSDTSFACSSELQQVMNKLQGVNIQQTGPNPPRPSTLEEKLHPTPFLNAIVAEALKSAGIKGIGNGYGYNDDPLNTITVFVGFRPRNKWGILPPSFYERDSFPQDVSDDDF